MNSQFFQQLNTIRDRAAVILNPGYNLGNVRSLYIKRWNGVSHDISEVIPSPVIVEKQRNLESLEGISNLKGVAVNFEVKGVSRQYQREELDNETTEFLIDSQTGILCTLVAITQNQLTWDLQLQQRVGEQELY